MVGWQVERVTELDLQDVEHLADELAMLYYVRRRAVISADPRVCVPAPARERLG